MALDSVSRELKKLSVQEMFIEEEGCNVLALWLHSLPDGTYPNIKIASEVLATLSALPIDPNMLHESVNLMKIVKAYSLGEAGT